MNRNIILSGILLVATLGAVGAASAEGNERADEAADAKALLAAKVTVVQAAQAAEARTGGKVSSVSFETQGAATPFYHVEVVTPDGAQEDVAVDAVSGEVAKVVAIENGQNGEDGELGGQEDQDGDGVSDQ